MNSIVEENVIIEVGNPKNAQVKRLLELSEIYARSLYPSESVHMLPEEELDASSVIFLVARDGGDNRILGCGAAVISSGYGEIKRMFVDSTARRRGIGRKILKALEKTVKSLGVTTMKLETGVSQPEAIALYQLFGYIECEPFGSYKEDPLSIFMEKGLVSDGL